MTNAEAISLRVVLTVKEPVEHGRGFHSVCGGGFLAIAIMFKRLYSG